MLFSAFLQLHRMLFEEIDAGLQKTEGMILSHKEPEGLKDILPIPKPLVYMQILPDHFTAIRYDWMKQGGGNPYDMEHIDQQLPDLRGILAFRPPGPILVCVSEVKIKQFKKLIKGKLGNQAFIFQNDLIGSRFYRLGDGAGPDRRHCNAFAACKNRNGPIG